MKAEEEDEDDSAVVEVEVVGSFVDNIFWSLDLSVLLLLLLLEFF